MFKTIVWATDGSEHADRALPVVIGIARLHRSKIVAVHANELLAGRFGGAPLLTDDPEVVAEIERDVQELRAAGFTAELRVARGIESVPTLIARAAEDADADLIVVGTHGHRGVASMLLGSVARALLHAAACPVLVVPPERRPSTARAA